MFCPNCGQPQNSNEARFCPACGFPLEAVGQLLAGGGRLQWHQPAEAPATELSPRQKGIRQGVMLMLLTLLVVPLIAIFGVVMLNLPGEFVAVAAVALPVGGFLRLIYALMYESNARPASHAPLPAYAPPPAMPNYLGAHARGSSLPPQQSTPVQPYVRPQRYNTGELVEPPRASVTDHTTRLLDKQPDEPPRQ